MFKVAVSIEAGRVIYYPDSECQANYSVIQNTGISHMACQDPSFREIEMFFPASEETAGTWRDGQI